MGGTVDLQILQNDSKNNPSVSASRSHAPGIRKRIPHKGAFLLYFATATYGATQWILRGALDKDL